MNLGVRSPVRRARNGIAAVAFGAGLLLASCGGDDTTSTPEGAAEAFIAAIRDDDTAGACELIHPDYDHEEVLGNTLGPKSRGEDCATWIDGYPATERPDEGETFTAEATSAADTSEGEVATVAVKSSGHTYDLYLRPSSDEWLVTPG